MDPIYPLRDLTFFQIDEGPWMVIPKFSMSIGPVPSPKRRVLVRVGPVEFEPTDVTVTVDRRTLRRSVRLNPVEVPIDALAALLASRSFGSDPLPVEVYILNEDTERQSCVFKAAARLAEASARAVGRHVDIEMCVEAADADQQH